MREPSLNITCDLCLYPVIESEQESVIQIRDKDICSHCALVVKRADMLVLITQLLKAIEEKYNSIYAEIANARNDS